MRLALSVAFSIGLMAPAGLVGQAQVRGVVRQAGTGAPLPDALIELVDRQIHAWSDSAGRFTLSPVPPGRHTLRVRRIGFEVLEVAIDGADTTELVLELRALALRLADIVVTPGRFGVMEQDVVSRQTLTREDIETIPQVGEDVFRAVKRLPGLTSDDISTRLNVRGGSDQELLTLLDGLELYEPYHLKDFDAVLGIVDINAIGSIDLATGGFPVRYGDKLTGVFDMTSRTPPPSGARTTLGLSITNANVMTRGRFGNGNGLWLLSVRRGYLDIALALTGGNDDLSPRYWDAFGKVEYQVHPNHRLGVRVLYASDALNYRSTDGDGVAEVVSGWKTSHAWLTWTAVPFARVTARTIASVGRFTRRRAGFLTDPERIRGPFAVEVDDDRVFRYGDVRHDLSVEVTDRLLVQVGGEALRGLADYAYQNATERFVLTSAGDIGTLADSVDVQAAPTGNAFSGYLSARIRPVDPFTAEAGVRYDHVSHTGDDDVAPRLSAALALGRHLSLRGSWGRYYQSHGLHELEVGDGETVFFPSDRATQIAVGLEYRHPANVLLRVEAYRRAMADQRPRFVNADRDIQEFPETEGDRVRIDPGAGRARGIELLASWDGGKRWAGSATYVLAEAVDRIAGRWVPRALDQRHTFGVSVQYRPASPWRLSAAFYVHTGWPATESTFRIDTLPDGSLRLLRELGPLGALRLPVYHRVDFRVSRSFPLGPGVLHTYLDVFNLYNRRNVRNYAWNVSVSRAGVVTVRRADGDDLLPILPSLGFRWEF